MAYHLLYAVLSDKRFFAPALRLLLLLSLLLFTFHSFAQKEVQLNEFTISETKSSRFSDSKYSAGTRLWEVDSLSLGRLSHNTLADYISGNTAVFIKESGNGMMSSISLRGTASSHTAVQWNGLTINPLTMGQMDFSLLPLFFFEQVAVHPGGESALYGNGAIGGSIVLGSKPHYQKRWKGLLQQSAGSYGYSFSGLKIQGGTEYFQSHTALLYNRSDNDFDIYKKTFSGEIQEKQRNASFYNVGATQDFYYKLNGRNEISINSWYTYNDREIQPSIHNNNRPAYYEDIVNRSVKAMANYKYSGVWRVAVNAGYLNDYMLNQEDRIETHNMVATANVERTWRKVSLKTGVSYQYIIPDVYSYSSGVTEWRTGIYLLSKYYLTHDVSVNANLQQNFVQDIFVPFTPSAGISWRVLRKPELSLRANVSKSFKVPSLNDRYWGGLDNTYLKSEEGLNAEGGLNLAFNINKYRSDFTVSVYRNAVENWIMWLPRGDLWKPQNIDCVLAQGVELYWKQSLGLNRFWQMDLTANYSYTNTRVTKAPQNMRAFENRQMPLLPEHTANMALQINYRKLFATVGLNFTGERATSNIFQVMDNYHLFDASIGYTFELKKQKIVVQMQANNILNEDYQTVPHKAMPRRNYCVTAKYVF